MVPMQWRSAATMPEPPPLPRPVRQPPRSAESRSLPALAQALMAGSRWPPVNVQRRLAILRRRKGFVLSRWARMPMPRQTMRQRSAMNRSRMASMHWLLVTRRWQWAIRPVQLAAKASQPGRVRRPSAGKHLQPRNAQLLSGIWQPHRVFAPSRSVRTPMPRRTMQRRLAMNRSPTVSTHWLLAIRQWPWAIRPVRSAVKASRPDRARLPLAGKHKPMQSALPPWAIWQRRMVSRRSQ